MNATESLEGGRRKMGKETWSNKFRVHGLLRLKHIFSEHYHHIISFIRASLDMHTTSGITCGG